MCLGLIKYVTLETFHIDIISYLIIFSIPIWYGLINEFNKVFNVNVSLFSLQKT